ncbi:ATP-dependent DNA helicase RecG [Candidatus Saccharibacteria bacterium]|nr:ATP-dependent DNA helicase RecG [Candidatus Saccharibacteria bacterium]
MQLDYRVTLLKGVGPIVQKGLARLGIHTVQDLLTYWPRRWDDFSTISKLNTIKPGRVAVLCTVLAVNVRSSQRQRRLSITEAVLTDGSGTIKAVWFNQPFLLNTLKKGEQYLFAGNFEFKNNYLSLNSPTVEPATQENYKGKIYSVYPETSGITSKALQKLIAQVIDQSSELSDGLPIEVEQEHQLIPFAQAVRQLHQPASMAEVTQAERRVGFAELFELILTGLVIKQDIKTETSPVVEFKKEVVEEVLSMIDFDLTDAQRKSAWQILQDLEKPQPMNRMLEGDVGSGKTLVALLATAMTLRAGYQVALMVPTEILARQHVVTTKKIFKQMGLTSELLISATPTAEKKLLHTTIADGKVDMVIGTHALLSEGVEFNNLGLVIIDEQHRFGVNQRRTLKTKASFMPHVLTMTATPIPRSLALVVYGDLDISVIDQLPPGRKPVETKVVREIDRSTVYFFVDQLLAQGQQAFIVCPLIEEADEGGAKSVKAEFVRLQKTVFSHRKIAMIHGRMKPDEKAEIMQEFRAGTYNILLATTVIEVGVDIPNATVLIIENADRFGLAALHQLRGRVGRSSVQSYCYLFSDSTNPNSYKRLQAMEKTTDGFRLAQIDLEMRGPGEIYGTSQHGVLDMRFANIFDTQLLAEVKQAASAFISGQNMVEYPQLVEKINNLKKLTSLD